MKLNILKPVELLLENKETREKKFANYRLFSAVMFFFSGFFGSSLWIWDYVTDPVGSMDTVSLRLSMLFLLSVGIAFVYLKSIVLLEIISLSAILLAEFLFVLILEHLENGMVYGIGGFMIFVFVPMLLSQGFSLKFNLAQAVIVAATPHLLALAGFGVKFQHAQYAVAVWPTVALMMLVYFVSAFNYRTRRDFEIALEQASLRDPMTSLYNRRYFEPLLQNEFKRCARLQRCISMMILDIDHFKSINDRYGHPTGDLVICTLADICLNSVREIDVVARLGGEEFAILLPEITANEALLVAERIRLMVEKTNIKSLGGEGFSFTVSIGIAEQYPEQQSENRLVNLADEALYESKQTGRNRVTAKESKIKI